MRMHITLLARPADDFDALDQDHGGSLDAANSTVGAPSFSGAAGLVNAPAPFDADELRETLRAFGRSDLASAFYADIPAARLFILACLLRVAARAIEEGNRRDQDASREGRPPSGAFNPASHRYTPWPGLPVEASVALIRRASEWLDSVRECGCVVYARRRREH